ncbi:hypothetical protein GGI15_002009 [Coemansia interrupta]|uniref:Protein arginine N-methyltransferase n=1 Tax=Coemansia interrupta TaxID=1126814 RepID=A0A9W8LLS7_9FUNG|nr:hypothetical protein GGI15_002009 [Coemansia interrupta]
MSYADKVVAVGVEPVQPIDDADAYIADDPSVQGADFVIIPITKGTPRVGASGFFALEDMVVRSSTNGYAIVGKTASWAGGPDDDALLTHQIAYARYVGLKRMMAPGPGPDTSLAEFARGLMQRISGDQAIEALLVRTDADAQSWRRWRRVRDMCGHSRALELALVLDDSCNFDRWRAEPVKLLIIPSAMFIPNDAGHPVLRRRDQKLVRQLADMGAAVAVQHTGDAGRHMAYLRFLLRPADRDAAALYSDAYRDVLQVPLQPLMDHLESETYATFEADLAKYDAYELAILRALQDSPQETPLVVVAGAGRGPLVARVLSAAKRAERPVRVVALEKNPGAMVELQRRNRLEWRDAVDLVFGDMRSHEPAEPADVLVSELLGSFGDNELAPECMDAAARRLLRPGGTCIPQTYAAYLAPLSSATLHARAAQYEGGHGLETPYVVNMHAAQLLAPSQRLWAFDHGERPAEPICFARHRRAEFAVDVAAVVHGFAGYFDAVLYADVRLSIRPEDHTADMHSWFPMFFPLAAPLNVEEGERVVVDVWRRCGAGRVWYEWVAQTPTAASVVHNVNGRQHWIGQ